MFIIIQSDTALLLFLYYFLILECEKAYTFQLSGGIMLDSVQTVLQSFSGWLPFTHLPLSYLTLNQFYRGAKMSTTTGHGSRCVFKNYGAYGFL